MNEYLKYGNLRSKAEDSFISGIPLANSASLQTDINRTLAGLDKARDACLAQLEPSLTKNPIYTAPSGADLIDEFAKNNTPDEFRAVINFNIQKYSKRYGKKDEQLKEARKIADYASRLVAFEEGLLNE